MSGPWPKIGIVVLSWNGEKFLEDCLGSLAKTNYPQESLFFFLVDNGSSDGSVKILKDFKGRHQALGIDLIFLNKNYGFAGGNNVGIKKAFAAGMDYVVLLNEDTIVEPLWLAHLLKVAIKDKKIFSVQARLMLWPAKNKVNSLGNEIHFLGFGFAGGYLEEYQAIEPREITYSSGAAVMLRAEKLDEVGFLDDDLFAYHEDLDLGWRARLRGYQNMLAPQAVVYHKYEFSRSIQKYYYMERNRFMVLLKYVKLGTLILLAPALILMELGLFIYSFKTGWWKEKLKAYGYFLPPENWRRILSKRKTCQKQRLVTDREIFSRFVGEIEFQALKNPFLDKFVNPALNLYWQIAKRFIFW